MHRAATGIKDYVISVQLILMYHKKSPFTAENGHLLPVFRYFQNPKLLVILALLICNAAGGLASRLAGGLALAASAVFNSLGNILCFDSLDSAHFFVLQKTFYRLVFTYIV